MLLCRVKGNIVSTHKNNYLVGHKLMIVQQIDLKGNIIGKDEMIALDLIDAGIGETVLVAKEGAAVQQILGHKNAPVNTIINAIVDAIEVVE